MTARVTEGSPLRRPHILYFYYDMQKWLLILLVPVLRAFFSRQDVVMVVLSSLRDVTTACLLIAYSFEKWRCAGYALQGGLIFEQGVFWRRRLRVSAEDAASVEVERSPLMWLLHGVRVRVNTAGLRRRADATLYLPASVVARYRPADEGRPWRRYRSQLWPVVVLAASSSNAAVGLLTVAPAMRQAGKILGREVTSEVYGLVERLVSLGLPPLLHTTANILVVGWGFAFLSTLLRTAGFLSRRSENQLHIVSGFLTRRDVYIDCSRITSLELRQTLFMRLFRLHTVTISAAGYGRERGSRPVIIPAARPRELGAALDSLLPDYPICRRVIHPGGRAVTGYVLPPLLFTLAGIWGLALGGVWTMASAVWIVGGMWWLLIRLAGFRRAGFGVDDDAVTLRYSRGLALYEVHVPREVVDCARIVQNPLQRRGGTCHVELLCFGEKYRRHRVRSLSYEEASKLVWKLAEGKRG